MPAPDLLARALLARELLARELLERELAEDPEARAARHAYERARDSGGVTAARWDTPAST